MNKKEKSTATFKKGPAVAERKYEVKGNFPTGKPKMMPQKAPKK